jgi:hypothetical protein
LSRVSWPWPVTRKTYLTETPMTSKLVKVMKSVSSKTSGSKGSRVVKAATAPLPARGAGSSLKSRTSKSSSGVLGSATAKLLKPLFRDTESAPAAVSSMEHRKFEMSGNLFTGVRLKVLEPFGGVCQPQSTVYDMQASSFPAFQIASSNNGTSIQAASTPYAMGLNPVAMPFYFAVSSTNWDTGAAFSDSNVQTLIASAFSRYRVSKLTFHYRPTCPSITQGRLVFAYSQDVSHPLIGISEFSTSQYPGLSTLENGSNSISFAPWVGWSLAVPVDSDPRYMSLDGVYGASTNAVYDAADLRHNCFGSVCCLNNVKSTGDALRVGELYWEIEMEFYDPVPISINYAIPLYMRMGLIGHGYVHDAGFKAKCANMMRWMEWGELHTKRLESEVDAKAKSKDPHHHDEDDTDEDSEFDTVPALLAAVGHPEIGATSSGTPREESKEELPLSSPVLVRSGAIHSHVRVREEQKLDAPPPSPAHRFRSAESKQLGVKR